MKKLLIILAMIFATSTAYAETYVMCWPTHASVSVNGITDVHQSNVLLRQAELNGKFRARFEYSPDFKTVQSASAPHHKWIGINDSQENTQFIAVMDFVTMTYTKTAYQKQWADNGSRILATNLIVSSCKKQKK